MFVTLPTFARLAACAGEGGAAMAAVRARPSPASPCRKPLRSELASSSVDRRGWARVTRCVIVRVVYGLL